jgi:hypothetical protein
MLNNALQTLAGILTLTVGFCLSLNAQIANGDFSSSTNGWRVVLLPGNRLIPAYGPGQIDIDGSGPLTNSPAFFANVGEDALLNLEQDIVLSAGVTYSFHADLASVPYSLNGDGGTISVFVGQTAFTSYSFGAFSSITPKYAMLATNYSAGASGTQTLSIHFSRGWGFGGVGNTPTDFIDNISLSPVRIPLIIQLNGGKVILTWTNPAFVLQSAPVPSGSYSNVPSATSPYTNAISGTGRYFRLLAN